ncbi:MAG: hypothetical protein ACE5OY_07880 [Candidatus Bathyarchaeia archaeon]
MVDRQKLMGMLIDALSHEEISLTPLLERFLRELAESEMDEAAKAEIEMKIRRILDETIQHSRGLTELMRRVMAGAQTEF